ncbi:MAG: hypothetical protein H6708_33300 [Kofleriaceae bacterium]|nr:hypothetical protein [Kofleriaceae bacterium]
MAKCFTSWTVLPHSPIEKINDHLWRVTGKMPDGKTQREMVLARMADGGVIVHNAIALDEPEMKELEAWGRPTVIFVPNSFHRQDCATWKQRYPEAKVVCPPGARKRVSKIVPVDLVSEDAPGDDRARLLSIEGSQAESILRIAAGDTVTLVFNDLVLNMPRMKGPVGFMLAPTGQVSSPRFARWMMIKDKRAFGAQLRRLADTAGLARIELGHGAPITTDAPGALRAVAAQLGA